MIVTLLRAIILYLIVIASVRLMGKRQIGELQPSELVVTILLSEVAAIPMQDNDFPLVNSIVAVILLVSFEVINSVFSMKSNKFRSFLQGNSLFIVRNGIIDQAQLRRLRLTVDDLLEALRQKDVFDIGEVQYAIIETNGQLSVLLKPENRKTTSGMMNVKVDDAGIPCLVVCDGRVIEKAFSECEMNNKKLDKAIKTNKLELKDIMLMTVDKTGKTIIVKKEGIG